MRSRLAGARAGSLATFAALAAAAVLLDLGRLHALEHGDSIVPVLVSLQRWTPFYWDQERYGMLVPLVALPVRDPLWNLLLQRLLLVLAGLAAVVLLARHVLAGREWRVAGALATVLVLLSWPAPWLFEYLGDQPYGLGLALALAGLAVAEPGPGGRRGPARLGAGLALVLLAHWVNAATGLLLVPLAVARAGVDLADGEPRRAALDRLVVDGALLVAGLAAGQVLLRLYPVFSGQPLRLATGALPVAEWPRAWAAYLGRAAREAGAIAAATGAVAAAGAAALLLPAVRPHARAVLLRAGALVAGAAVYALLTGTFAWVRDNAWHWRYLAPAVLLVQLAAVAPLAEALAAAGRLARAALPGAVALVPLAALAAAGPPSLARVRADLDRVAGRWTEDVLAARCDLVTGDYWSVWPAVWHVAWSGRARGTPVRVYGLAHRANPTVPAWRDRPSSTLRVCRVRGAEGAADRALRDYGLWPARVVERRATVDVLVPAPGRAPGAAPAPGGGAATGSGSGT
ncbi:hypothetical protein [Anaeromyxobacter oryzae]|uniref:Glycosyltransferase RgtA/B/C/D-like domain-containing protein n=1 Tax=Anaeromyxobacter oryzae TaxID=2918170 RepID=A0ABM7WQU9_9BACT|nr:hypothetical protein [Anaeromyxobacter oryzae]BDG01845.1 hypothetical protein AMOR_08410 [Anaeromyxobacter oryzae]